jgi:hypothetical protein
MSITKKKWFAALMAVLITVAYMPVAMLTGTENAYAADTIAVKLDKSSASYTYGGSGLAHHYTVTVNGKTRQAYCLQPNEVPPDTGSRKASAMSDSSKVAKTMYYCYGYPGQKKLASWLSGHGHSSYNTLELLSDTKEKARPWCAYGIDDRCRC